MSKSHSKRNKKQKQEKNHEHHEHPPPANAPSPTPSTPSAVTDFRPAGNRKSKGSDDASVAETSVPKAANAVPTGDLVLPGVTPGQEEKTSLKIKVHLNLHAKVRIDVDAQLYGDIIIGLL